MKKIIYLVLLIISICIMVGITFIPSLQTMSAEGHQYLGVPAFWLVIYENGSIGFKWLGFLLNVAIIYIVVILVIKLYQLFYRFISR